MNIKPVTDADFESEVLKHDGPVLVIFTASWCGPCKQLNEALLHVKPEDSAGIKFCTLDVDANPAMVKQYTVRGVPALSVFNGGAVTQRRVGYPGVAGVLLMIRQAAQLVTAKAPALTETYVQPVPDHCDRIMWRGTIYHLPPKPGQHFMTDGYLINIANAAAGSDRRDNDICYLQFARAVLAVARGEPATIPATVCSTCLGKGSTQVRFSANSPPVDIDCPDCFAMQKPYSDECPDCGRMKAHSADQCAAGLCPKWYAVRDADARDDCVDFQPGGKFHGMSPDQAKAAATAAADCQCCKNHDGRTATTLGGDCMLCGHPND